LNKALCLLLREPARISASGGFFVELLRMYGGRRIDLIALDEMERRKAAWFCCALKARLRDLHPLQTTIHAARC